MNLATARTRYIQHIALAKDLSPHTLRAYASDVMALERHVGALLGIDALQPSMFVSFFDAQRHDGCCTSTVRRRAASLRGFCKWLVAQDLVQENPWPGSPVAASRARTLPRLLPQHDLQVLTNTLIADSDLSDEVPSGVLRKAYAATTLLAVLLMTTTGARVNEIVSLRQQDVDPIDRSMRITGKGRRERQVYLVNDWITGLVQSYLLTRREMCVAHPKLLFNSRGAPLTTYSVRSRLHRVSTRLALSVTPTPHMLRHTAATRLIEADVDIRYIQRLLGHSSLTTTEIYTHVTDPALRRAVTRADVMGGILGPR